MKRLIIGLGIILILLFSGCAPIEPVETNLGKITGIKSFVDGGAFSKTSCIVEVNNTLDITLKGYHCNMAEEGLSVIKIQHFKQSGEHNYYNTIIK